jgi:hypothetical protein
MATIKKSTVNIEKAMILKCVANIDEKKPRPASVRLAKSLSRITDEALMLFLIPSLFRR